MIVEVEGRPAPKGSRIAAKTKTGRAFTYPASKAEAPWIKAIADATRLVMRHHETLSPPYVVMLDFRLRMPLKQNRKHSFSWPSSRNVGDIDKLARAAVDGLVKGGALEDDRHIVELHVSKRWASDDEAPGVQAWFDTAAQPVSHDVRLRQADAA